jgi:hypothetical protein
MRVLTKLTIDDELCDDDELCGDDELCDELAFLDTVRPVLRKAPTFQRPGMATSTSDDDSDCEEIAASLRRKTMKPEAQALHDLHDFLNRRDAATTTSSDDDSASLPTARVDSETAKAARTKTTSPSALAATMTTSLAPPVAPISKLPTPSASPSTPAKQASSESVSSAGKPDAIITSIIVTPTASEPARGASNTSDTASLDEPPGRTSISDLSDEQLESTGSTDDVKRGKRKKKSRKDSSAFSPRNRSATTTIKAVEEARPTAATATSTSTPQLSISLSKGEITSSKSSSRLHTSRDTSSSTDDFGGTRNCTMHRSVVHLVLAASLVVLQF